MKAPPIGTRVPRRDYGPLGAIGRGWLRATGWRVGGDIPDLRKAVVVVAPHSSNWDFVVAVSVVFALGLRVGFIGKHTLFRGLIGSFMRWLGGIPVDRTNPDGVARAAADTIRATDALWLGIAPEGTRTRGARFKSGFYRIAAESQVPIIPVAIDYLHRSIVFHAPRSSEEPLASGVEAIRALLTESGCRRDDARAARSRDP